jgi:hypothetical protein
MDCREVTVTGRRMSGRRPPWRPVGHLACQSLRSHRLSLDPGTRPVSNACSGETGEYLGNEINSYLGNPGTHSSAPRRAE